MFRRDASVGSNPIRVKCTQRCLLLFCGWVMIKIRKQVLNLSPKMIENGVPIHRFPQAIDTICENCIALSAADWERGVNEGIVFQTDLLRLFITSSAKTLIKMLEKTRGLGRFSTNW